LVYVGKINWQKFVKGKIIERKDRKKIKEMNEKFCLF